ncbi:hypothetical protein ACFOPS_04695 [Ralstonia solanacearum]|uniref:hypothetical protein n=1 Tax=Ralstonia solanacearum TaxID=305 RepID=UPI0036097532
MIPFMAGQTQYMDTPVVPVQAFASGYNPPDCAYPDATPAVSTVLGDALTGGGRRALGQCADAHPDDQRAPEKPGRAEQRLHRTGRDDGAGQTERSSHAITVS